MLLAVDIRNVFPLQFGYQKLVQCCLKFHFVTGILMMDVCVLTGLLRIHVLRDYPVFIRVLMLMTVLLKGLPRYILTIISCSTINADCCFLKMLSTRKVFSNLSDEVSCHEIVYLKYWLRTRTNMDLEGRYFIMFVKLGLLIPNAWFRFYHLMNVNPFLLV